MKTILLALMLCLTGCGTIARIYDSNDPCQTRAELGRPKGYQIPSWCGASDGRQYFYDNRNRRIGYVEK